MASGNLRQATDRLPDRVLEEAAIWHARLRDAEKDPDNSATDRTDFTRWLTADPRNRAAFEEMEKLWGALEAPVAGILARDPVPVPAGRRRRRFAGIQARALAACLAIALVTAVFWQDGAVWLRSDHSTAIGERHPVALSDGSRLLLNSGTAVAVDLKGNSRQVKLLRGEAWFEVARDANRPFLVQTATGTVRVTGTRFNVRVEDGAAIVSLVEGRVELESSAAAGDRASKALAPGRQARLSPTGISVPRPFDRTAVTAWQRGQIVFYDAPLARVVAELNRYRLGRIVLASDRLDGMKVSGVFRTDDANAALSAIGNTLPVRIVRLTDYLVLLR